MNTPTEEKIRVVSQGGMPGAVSLEGFSKESIEKFLAAMNSAAYYVQVKDGKLVAIPTWEELPKPTEDKTMTPFWRRHTESKQPELFDEFEHSKDTGILTLYHNSRPLWL